MIDVLSTNAKYDSGFSVRFTSFAKYRQTNGESIPMKIENKIYIFRINFILFITKFEVMLYIVSTIYNNVFKNYTIIFLSYDLF